MGCSEEIVRAEIKHEIDWFVKNTGNALRFAHRDCSCRMCSIIRSITLVAQEVLDED